MPLGALIGPESGRTILRRHRPRVDSMRRRGEVAPRAAPRVVETTLLESSGASRPRARADGAPRRRARGDGQQGTGRLRVPRDHVVTGSSAGASCSRRRHGRIPVFNLVRETLPAVDILGFPRHHQHDGALRAHGDGVRRTYDEALAEMQAEGIAEADPSFDVDGWTPRRRRRRSSTCSCAAP